MRPFVLAAGLALLLPLTASADDFPVDHLSLPAGSARSVHLSFPVGDLRVEASTDSRVSLEITAHCKGWGSGDCADYAKRVRIETDNSGGRLDLKVEGYPKFHGVGFDLRGVLHVPASMDLDLDMGVGDLKVADVEGDLSVDLGVGDAEIRTATGAVHSVDVATGVGDADVITRSGHIRRHGFIGSTATWDEGRGRSSVNLHVGVGDATVRLD